MLDQTNSEHVNKILVRSNRLMLWRTVNQGRPSDSQLKEPRFESCVEVSILGQPYHSTSFQFTQLYEYLAIDSGGYVYTNSLRALRQRGWMIP